jgi:histidinol-phosphate aminotransferase
MLVNDAYRTLQPYVPGKPVSETERELGITGAVKLASNENPLGPSPLAIAAVRDALPCTHDYPDGSCFHLKRDLAAHLRVSATEILVGNGTNEIIEMLVRTCIRPGEHMLYQGGSFVIYKLCALASGSAVVEVPMGEDRTYDLEALGSAATEKTKLVFLANPNNPTGTAFGRAALSRFVARLPEPTLVVLDEAYREYARAPDYPDGMDFRGPRFLFMRTFSKCYGLAGLRVGYAVGDAELMDYLNRGRQPFNVNTLAQVAARAALADTDHVRRTVALNAQELPRVRLALHGLGVGTTESHANFVFADFATNAADIFARMLREGVIIRPMAGYGFPTCARISVGTVEQNDRMLAALARVLRG